MNTKPGIVKEGWLKRVKNQKRRYFVLCFNKDTGAAQLQYYESDKKFNSKLDPKRTIFLRDCLGIISKDDPKYGQVLVLYTKEDVFALMAETEEVLQSWLNDLDKLHKMENKNLQESKYDLVWNVTVLARGLGGVKNMTGHYKLCLKNDSLFFVNPSSQEVLNEEKLYHIRRYGHMDYCFFMEFGRSTTLGAGEIWMEVEDPLIAQKIHETLSRSVKPPRASGEIPAVSKKAKPVRPIRHSMVVDSRRFAANPTPNSNNNNNNNNPSPKTRRFTVLPSVFSKKKETIRPHSKSISGVPSPVVEQDAVPKTPIPYPGYTQEKDEDDSEDEHYPHITPPAPSIPSRTSRSSFSGSQDENIQSKNDQAGSPGADTKSVDGAHAHKPHCNDYSLIKPKRRSVMKQDCSAVRKDYAAEQRRSRSLPRRSSSSSEPARRGSNRNSDEEHDGDSDRDGGRDSDTEQRRLSLELAGSHYLNMNPRQRITSDSSSEEPSPYVPVGPKPEAPGMYIKMSSPRQTPNLEKSRVSGASLRSSDSGNSSEEPAMLGLDSDFNPYMNMAPGSRIGSSSNESTEDDPTADAGEETFDHLSREDHVNDENALSHGNEQCYVNMSPQSAASGTVKSKLQTQRSMTSDYVNVNINRTGSLGSKTSRPRPVFEIVPEPHPSSDDEAFRHSPSNYVNIRTKSMEPSGSDPNLQSWNSSYTQKQTGGSRKKSELNYACVDFSEIQPSTTNGTYKPAYQGRKSPSNYTKIDFQKSKGLAEISSSRERQLQGIHQR